MFSNDRSIFETVLRSGKHAVKLGRKRVASVLITKLFKEEDKAWIIDLLIELKNEDRYALVLSANRGLTTALKEAIQTRHAFEEARKEATSEAATTTTARRNTAVSQVPVEEDESDEPFDPTKLLEELGRLLDETAEDAPSVEILIRTLLRVDAQATRDAVEPVLEGLQVVELETIKLIARRALPRLVDHWPTWLGALPSGAVCDEPGARAEVLELVDRLWYYAVSQTPPSDEDLRSGASALARLLDEADDYFAAQVAAHAVQLGDSVNVVDEIPERARRIHVAHLFASSGLTSDLRIMNEELDALAETLTSEIEVEEPESPLVEYVIGGVEKCLQFSSSLGEDKESGREQTIAEAVVSCQWLSEPDRARLEVVVLGRVSGSVGSSGLVVPPAVKIASYSADLSAGAFDQLVGSWLISTTEELTAVLPIVSERLLSEPSPRLLSATRLWAEKLNSDERYQLVAAFAGTPGVSLPSDAVLDAVGLSRIPDGDVVSMLVDRLEGETSNPYRKLVLDLWKRADITDQPSKIRAIRRIMLPLLALNGQATTLALSSMRELVHPVPNQVRKQLAEAVVKATKGQGNLEDRGRRVLSELGYSVERKGLFGMRKEVDTSS